MDKKLRALILIGLFVIPAIITIYIYQSWKWGEIHSSLWQLLLFALIVAIIFLPGIMIIFTLWMNDRMKKMRDNME